MTDIRELHAIFLASEGVCTDTRKLQKGQVFFALKGDNFNGNLYAEKALDLGASYAVVDEVKYATNEQYILVDDALDSLQKLANFHRKQFSIPILAITGSNGKTTTKELLNAVLSEKFHVLATKGNLNNHIGVPLTLLEITDAHTFAIIEMGASKLGDIRELCEIAEPTYGIITNIGRAHLGPFGGIEQIIRTKSELYQHLILTKGKVFINASNPILSNMAKRFSSPILYLEEGQKEYRYLKVNPFLELEVDEEILKTKLIGSYNFENVVTALVVGKHFGVDRKLANKAIENYVPSNNRSQILETKSNKIILDAYNANPSSMEVALENFQNIEAKNKVVVLGDMLELGKESESEHKKLGEKLKTMNLEKVFLVGEEMQFAKKLDSAFLHFENTEKLMSYLEIHKIENSFFLIKGSRGIALEKISALL